METKKIKRKIKNVPIALPKQSLTRSAQFASQRQCWNKCIIKWQIVIKLSTIPLISNNMQKILLYPSWSTFDT
ncbi:unnamed protein product [Paramecium octaurelia]|uniref:Uncharacterized protein n=1 Tax=Paramecium octaurelia TaxID=43137 RepID=A0A8S1YP65_PAROT|nr:unnamed protein product [Paramecium octaurelia]